EMNIYLRPETLFGTKFEAYLNQKPKGGPPRGPNQNGNAAFARTLDEDGNPVQYKFS
ncbi:hypothetical protein HN289_19720, partial [Acinetobacter baumannii]|nr:hypothetical protein [Acinetobacter baumannii]